ncbi:uncharacterized protein SPSK_08109 [Sporothrix schenckii 1099-18]|uniref:Uncharacterized protein n=1 Tax=Sporothrix schenckii 1099-18 TaxID=1397361 RepID=A0A0F2MIR3_SPOSC|nr:uncharacterized protein SPSK_08109 [Sporothrix schenckii 1099-18]KJR88939.1 hypothetical protein SPSK_08109 [Sporothrix schenckii 1099-18]
MYFSAAAIAAALAFAQTALAAPVSDKVAARSDPHELDFRTFGVEGCHDENQGVYTLELSSNHICQQFVDPIGSLIASDNLCTRMSPCLDPTWYDLKSTANGLVTIYADTDCSVSPVVVPTNVCQNGVWQSYKMDC